MCETYSVPLPAELKTPAKGKESPRVKLVDVPNTKLTKSVATIQGLAPYLGAFAISRHHCCVSLLGFRCPLWCGAVCSLLELLSL